MTSKLPDFNRPPIREVVLGVQFDALSQLLTPHYGRFWETIERDYPEIEDRSPLPDVFDEAVKEPGLEAFDLPPLRRVFFIDRSKRFLLQVQSSRFLHNWRKVEPNDPYPHFPASWERFAQGWATFVKFIESNKLGAVRANQYELTYINHIEADSQDFPARWSRYTPLFAWDRAQSLRFLPPPKAASLDLRFSLPDGRGSLSASLKHAFRRSDKKDVLVLELTARGGAKPDWSDMESWFRLAHEWIVVGFTDLTSADAHAQWERRQ